MEYRILFIEDSPDAYHSLLGELAAHPLPGMTYQKQSVHAFTSDAVQGLPTGFQLVVAILCRRSGVLSVLRKLRAAYPNTQVLLLRHSDARLVEIVAAKELGAMIIPVTTTAPNVHALLGRLISQRTPVPVALEPWSAARAERDAGQVAALLDEIRHEAHAELALYTDTVGHIIDQQGETRGIDISAVTSLVAGGFINAVELGRALQDPETQHFSVHEGRHYNVYSINVGSDWLLTLVFNKYLTPPKIGVVMLLMKRGAERLNHLRSIASVDDRTIDPQFSLSLSTEFDRVFGRELQPVLLA